MDLMKEKIALCSRKLFDAHGFHGATLRELCKLSLCTMPTIYYYFKNKEQLFDESVRVAFEELVARLWSQLPGNVSVQEYAAQMVIQKKQLSPDEKLIYRLALKTWLGFEGCDKSRKKLMDWERAEYENSRIRYGGIAASERWAQFIARSVTNIIQRIILLDDTMSDREIREEVGMIFDVASFSKNKQTKENENGNTNGKTGNNQR